MTTHPWERLPDETPRAYECFKAYLDAGPSRQVKEVYRLETGRTKARAVAGVWNGWISRYNWQERVRAYDAYCDRKAHEAAIESRKKEHADKLEQFRKAHEQFGMGGMDVSLRALKLLSEFLKSEVKITTLADAERVGRLINLSAASSQAWADALGVRTLLDQLDATQG